MVIKYNPIAHEAKHNFDDMYFFIKDNWDIRDYMKANCKTNYLIAVSELAAFLFYHKKDVDTKNFGY